MTLKNEVRITDVHLSTGQPDPELPASAAIDQSGSDANHLHLSPLLPFLRGSRVDRRVQRVEVRQHPQTPLKNSFFNNICSYIIIPHAPDLGLIWFHLVMLLSLTPSQHCGPFQGLNNTFSVVEIWIGDLREIPGSDWVVWIYLNIIKSEVFYFLITLIIMYVHKTYFSCAAIDSASYCIFVTHR